ncbi:hypothetical protein EMIT0111MI5_340015 [Burkholderia sp. IT-111MI5]
MRFDGPGPLHAAWAVDKAMPRASLPPFSLWRPHFCVALISMCYVGRHERQGRYARLAWLSTNHSPAP